MVIKLPVKKYCPRAVMKLVAATRFSRRFL
jgi:hypothetical protein